MIDFGYGLTPSATLKIGIFFAHNLTNHQKVGRIIKRRSALKICDRGVFAFCTNYVCRNIGSCFECIAFIRKGKRHKPCINQNERKHYTNINSNSF